MAMALKLVTRILAMDLTKDEKMQILVGLIRVDKDPQSLLNCIHDDELLKDVLVLMNSDGIRSCPQTPLKLSELVSYLRRFVGTTQTNNCATVISENLLATHAHGEHQSLNQGDPMRVVLNKQQIPCRVLVVNRNLDFTLLRSEKKVEAPRTDNAKPGGRYVLVARSARDMTDWDSVSDGMFVSGMFDAKGHIRGSASSCLGDSGGGVFSVPGGELISIDVGNDLSSPGGHQARSHSVPVLPLLFLASALQAEESSSLSSHLSGLINQVPPKILQLFKNSF